MTTPVAPEFSRPVDAESVPALGRRYEIAATDAELQRVAGRLGLRALKRLTASFDVSPTGRQLVRVAGRIEADVVQDCVVTLQPLPVVIRDEVERTFVVPGTGSDDGEGAEAANDTDFDLDAEPPDEAVGGQIDLGELAVEHLALTLDPYPRAPGVVFTATDPGEPATTSDAGPFAALAKLKTGYENN
ncbi:MAG: DUF177 domain-containing protein [Rhodospirillaceae bacterium]|nr:DUF177 domain-containing protein [Rhodospirillaceae bacterium]